MYRKYQKLYGKIFLKVINFIFGQISELRTQCNCKNRKVKALSKHQNESTQPKGSTPGPAKGFPAIRKNLENCKESVRDEAHS